MNIDQLIGSALSGGGHLIGATKDTFVLEGNPQTNELRIVTGEIYILNTYLFARGEASGYCFLGMFPTREAAEHAVQYIRTLMRDEKGNNLLGENNQS